MRYFATIQQILNSRLATLDNLPTWERENLALQSEETNIFIKTQLLPAQTRYPNVGLHGFEVEAGTFAIYIKAVRQTGWGPYSNLVDDILEHFERSTTLTDGVTDVRILKSYALPGLFDANGRYTIPIHIRYEAYNLI